MTERLEEIENEAVELTKPQYIWYDGEMNLLWLSREGGYVEW
jgi:hypothetical protein